MFLLAIIAGTLVGMVAFPLAFAQTDPVDEGFVGELVNIGISNAGIGGAAGFIMSLLAVTGKRLTSSGDLEPIKLKLLLITVAIGGAIGYFSGVSGITSEVAIPSTMGILYIVNQTLRPILSKWVTS